MSARGEETGANSGIGTIKQTVVEELRVAVAQDLFLQKLPISYYFALFKVFLF